MLCHLVGMKLYLTKCLNDGPYVPMMTNNLPKQEAYWSNEERMVVNHDQRVKSIFISCLLDGVI